MKISIIIPTFNEAEKIGQLLEYIQQNAAGVDYEILVADGGSSDTTPVWVNSSRAKLISCPQKGRAAQMNYAAARCNSDLLFFLHADSFPPSGFLQQIILSVNAGADAGCFRLKFDSRHWFLRANAWFTRFNLNAFRFGDQGLFVKRSFFEEIKGYREDHIVMEDQDMVIRLRKAGARFKVIPDYVLTSSRKYRQNGPVRLQFIFFLIWLNYYRGWSQEKLVQLYLRKIRNSKIDASDAARAKETIDSIHQKP